MNVTTMKSGVTTGVLIAGGGSRRMGGLDKRYLVLGGRTLLVRNVSFLQSVFPEVGVVVGRGGDFDLGDAAGAWILHDSWPGRSPLVGIATALAAFRRPVFVLAADLACPSADVVLQVCAAYAGHDVAMPYISGGFREPLFAVYGPACLAPMEDLIRADRHRIVDIFPRVRVAEVPVDEGRAFRSFRNINTVDDYVAARAATAATPDECYGEAPPAPARLGVGSGGAAAETVSRLVPELGRLGMRVRVVAVDSDASASQAADGHVPRGGGDRGRDADDPGRDGCDDVDLVIHLGLPSRPSHRVEVVKDAGQLFDSAAASDGAGAALAIVSDADVRHPHRFGTDDMAGLARFLAVRLDLLRTA